MTGLYSEIKSLIVRVKNLLARALDDRLNTLGESSEGEIKTMLKFLLVLKEDKGHLQAIFSRV